MRPSIFAVETACFLLHRESTATESKAVLVVDLGSGRLCPVFQIDEDRTNWRIAVPNWELMDLRGRESTRLFFTFILQMLRACQELKEGAYAGAFGAFRKCGGIVSSARLRNCFICGR
jgi:hypothetical protein